MTRYICVNCGQGGANLTNDPHPVGYHSCGVKGSMVVETPWLRGYAAAPQAVQARITIDFKQATDLIQMFGGEPTECTLTHGDGHSGRGLYAHLTEYPEDGAGYLGESDADAIPDATHPTQQGLVQDKHLGSFGAYANENDLVLSPYGWLPKNIEDACAIRTSDAAQAKQGGAA